MDKIEIPNSTEVESSIEKRKPYNFEAMFKNTAYKIDYVPIDSRERISRWGGYRSNSVRTRGFSVEEIEEIIRSGDISDIRELSRYYYRTNGRYRNNIDFLAKLFLYETLVTPIYESGKGS